MNHEQLVDRYYLEHRGKIVDLAAFLDRLDRTPGHDPRLPPLKEALAMLLDGQPERARRILELWSEP